MIQDKIRGCLLGGAIGDALGYQIEFKRGIRDKQVTRFNNNYGIVSDDTQMTLFIANALIWHITQILDKGISMPVTEAVYNGYLDWLDTQKETNSHTSISWIKSIPELNKRRAPGNTCLSSLDSGKMGSIQNKINNSKGCGSVMRIAPYGIYTSDADSAGLLAADCAAITHGHKVGWIASYVCASIISMLIHQDIEIEQALKESLRLAETHSNLFYEKPRGFFSHTPMPSFMNLIDRAVWLSKEPLSDVDCIRQIGEGWTAEEALAIAVYSCLKHHDNFEKAIVCAANHDGDSDSTAAIAGNIMGAALGLQSIPTYFLENVELKDIILEMANDLTTAKNLEFDSELESSWKIKYIDCKLIAT